MRHALLVGIALALAACGSPVEWAVSGPLEDAGAAINKGDYAAALRLYRLLADKGEWNSKSGSGSGFRFE
jgi:hypothetical protein